MYMIASNILYIVNIDYDSYPKLFYVQCQLTYFLILANIAELMEIDS